MVVNTRKADQRAAIVLPGDFANETVVIGRVGPNELAPTQEKEPGPNCSPASRQRTCMGNGTPAPLWEGRFYDQKAGSQSRWHKAYVPARRDIFWIDLNPQAGREQAGPTPLPRSVAGGLQRGNRPGRRLSHHRAGEGLSV